MHLLRIFAVFKLNGKHTVTTHDKPEFRPFCTTAEPVGKRN